LIAAARFQGAADAVGDNALQPELAAAADRLFDAGLSRLSKRGSDMVGARVRNICDLMAKWIESIEQDISAKDRRIANLRERIMKLESQPDPDLGQIQELEDDIRELERALESDRPQLAAFQGAASRRSRGSEAEQFQAVCT
jgi:septal ring factor EnvC (AmiA/AmiB activator)